MRRIIHNNNGSAYNVVIFIVIIAIIGLVILIMNSVMEPFINLMGISDDTVKTNVSEPRGYFRSFINYMYPKGLLLVLLIGCSLALIMSYQKKHYMET